MDTVKPCEGKKRIVDGEIVRSDGTTILGGDDAAGMVIILETIRRIREQNVRCGNVFAVFTIAEEVGLLGSKYLEYDRLSADYAFVFDSGGPAGTISNIAPSQITMDIAIKGKAAHAGIEPEKGISAIQVFAKAVSEMKLGRIDEETTANVGVVNAGTATNIICDSLTARAEARSLSGKKLEDQATHMEKRFSDACAELGAELTFESFVEYKGFTVNPDSPIISKLESAAGKLGIEIVLEKTGGGSDTNILNEMGIMAVNLSAGMYNAHTTDEYADLGIVEKTVELMVETIKGFTEM